MKLLAQGRDLRDCFLLPRRQLQQHGDFIVPLIYHISAGAQCALLQRDPITTIDIGGTFIV